jgi:hypothetical protein
MHMSVTVTVDVEFYTFSEEVQQLITSFTHDSRDLKQGEDTRECTGFLQADNGNTLSIVGNVVKAGGKIGAPSVHREFPESSIEIHPIAFHSHPHHSQRKFNPPTTQDVKLFAIFRTYSKEMRPLEQARTHHIVFTKAGDYVIRDTGISKILLSRISAASAATALEFRKTCIKEADKIFDSEKNSEYEKELMKLFPQSPGLLGVDAAGDNLKVKFFQTAEKHADYLHYFEKGYGVTIDFFPKSRNKRSICLYV